MPLMPMISEIDPELQDEIAGRLADDGAVHRPHHAAGDDHLDRRVLAEDRGDLQVVGDDPQARMLQQCPGHFLVGGADVDEQRGIVRDMLGAEPRDPLLLVELLHLARRISGVLDAGSEAGAAVVARDQVLVGKLVDVAADGLRCDVEVLRQRVDRHEAALPNQFDDAGMSFFALHDRPLPGRHLATGSAKPKAGLFARFEIAYRWEKPPTQ